MVTPRFDPGSASSEPPNLLQRRPTTRKSTTSRPLLSGDPPSRASAGQVNPADYVLSVVRWIHPWTRYGFVARNDRALPATLGRRPTLHSAIRSVGSLPAAALRQKPSRRDR